MNRDWFYQQSALGEILRRARMDCGYSLRQLEKESGVSASHLLRIESGEFNIQLGTFVKVAQHLGIPNGLALEQAVRVSPGFYSKVIGERGIGDFQLLVGKSTPSERLRCRAQLIDLSVGCSVALAYLLRSSTPIRLVETIAFPFDELKTAFGAVAVTIDQMRGTDRLSLLRCLAAQPIEVLLHLGVPSKELALIGVRNALPQFSGCPDYFRLM